MSGGSPVAAPPYFPVRAEHRMPGPHWALGDPAAGATHLEYDADPEPVLQEKRRLWAGGRTVPDACPAGTQAGVRDWLRETVRREHPARADRVARGATLADAMLEVQEDLVVMHRPAGAEPADAVAAWLHVSFPTGWCPDCALGEHFVRIHDPVPGLHAFRAANRPNLARNLFRKPFVRFVWSLTPDAALRRPRCAAGRHETLVARWDDATAAWFRVERQVVVPLDAATSLFMIRVHRTPVGSLLPAQRETLRRCVAAMDPALTAYKGFAGHEARLAALLD
jgi:hypothetical protein